jgi:hypothetical protein
MMQHSTVSQLRSQGDVSECNFHDLAPLALTALATQRSKRQA